MMQDYLGALGPPGVPNFARLPGAVEAQHQAGQQQMPVRGVGERDAQKVEDQGQRRPQQGANPQPPQPARAAPAGPVAAAALGNAGVGPDAHRAAFNARQARIDRAQAALASLAAQGQALGQALGQAPGRNGVAAKARDLLALSRVGPAHDPRLGNPYWQPQRAPGVVANGQGQQVVQPGGPFNPPEGVAAQNPQAVQRQPLVHPVFGFPYPQFGPGFNFPDPPGGAGGVQ